MAKHALVGTALALLVGSATPAFAQSRPFQGLFGPAADGSEPPRTLNLTASVFGAYDTKMHRLLTNALGTDTARPIYYTDVDAGLWYTQRGQHTTFSANGITTMQHFPQIGNAVRWSGAGAVALSTTAERDRFGIDQEMLYTPFVHFRVIPIPGVAPIGLADVAAPDASLAVTGREAFRYNTALDWSHQLTRQSTLSASYRHEYLNFGSAALKDWRLQNIGISYTHSLTAKTAFVAGYVYHRRGFQGDPAPTLHHDINVGVNYSDTLPFSPKTTLSFSIGTTTLSRTITANNISTDSQFLRLIGDATVDHRLGQTWHLGATYNRGVQYIEGVSDVFMAYTGTGSLTGYLTPRVDVRVTAGYSTGALRFGTRQRAYDTNASAARLRVAISRNFALESEYTYYRYLFSNAVTLPTGIPLRENRNVIRVGLTTWLPLLDR